MAGEIQHVCEKEAIINAFEQRLNEGEARFERIEDALKSMKSWIGINGKPIADDNESTILGRLRRIEGRMKTAVVEKRVYIVAGVVGLMVLYVLLPFVRLGDTVKGTVDEEVIQVIVERTVNAVLSGKRMAP